MTAVKALFRRFDAAWGRLFALAIVLAVPTLQAQSGSQNQQQPSAQPQSTQDIPDTPSAVQPPAPKTAPKMEVPPPAGEQATEPAATPQSSEPQKTAPPPMPPVQTIPPGSMPEATQQGSGPKNEINPRDDLYKISVTTNFVQIPVLVKYKDGRRVEGLLPSDFTVLENKKPQKLTYFTSDPFQLSVAILLDLGMRSEEHTSELQSHSFI